ncbi:hypothetical protein L7F22_019826 [Adiantum nelumboides]|nr:hypothetical protein [Adiantum nelumboides]
MSAASTPASKAKKARQSKDTVTPKKEENGAHNSEVNTEVGMGQDDLCVIWVTCTQSSSAHYPCIVKRRRSWKPTLDFIRRTWSELANLEDHQIQLTYQSSNKTISIENEDHFDAIILLAFLKNTQKEDTLTLDVKPNLDSKPKPTKAVSRKRVAKSEQTTNDNKDVGAQTNKTEDISIGVSAPEEESKAVEGKNSKAAEEKKPTAAEEKKLKAAEEKKSQAAEEKKLTAAQEKKLKAAEEKKLKAAEEKKSQAAEEKKLTAAQEKKLKAAEEKKLKAEEEKKSQVSEEKEPTAAQEKKLKAAEEKKSKAEEKKPTAAEEKKSRAAEEKKSKAAEEEKSKTEEKKPKVEANVIKESPKKEEKNKTLQDEVVQKDMQMDTSSSESDSDDDSESESSSDSDSDDSEDSDDTDTEEKMVSDAIAPAVVPSPKKSDTEKGKEDDKASSSNIFGYPRFTALDPSNIKVSSPYTPKNNPASNGKKITDDNNSSDDQSDSSDDSSSGDSSSSDEDEPINKNSKASDKQNSSIPQKKRAGTDLVNTKTKKQKSLLSKMKA